MSTAHKIQAPGGVSGFGGLRPTAPMSNAQRQRRFRQRHPGYFRKYNARHKGQRKAAKAACEARHLAMAEARTAPLFAELILAPHLPAPASTPVVQRTTPIGEANPDEPQLMLFPASPTPGPVAPTLRAAA